MAEAPTRSKPLVHLDGNPVSRWMHKHMPFLFRWDSVFYFGLFVFLLGFAWTAYSLFTDSFTQLLNWDYTWQYVPFSYTYWDAWHTFFSTGHFPMYDTYTWIGTDSVGSNSYYGLFDPFVVMLSFFPRGWIPQMFAVMTFVKLMVTTLIARSYLKYMGLKEWTARFGALAIGFSGYICFMVGFPSFLSAATYVPLILLGIEKVIKERKPTLLIIGLFLEGITSFFFLVVICIFGVIYAVWRYFWTLKQRKAIENWKVIGMGVLAFALGILLSCFSLLPSIRETMLSGRGTSIGTAYLKAIIKAFKSLDARSFLSLIFESVGDNPGRELMALISFFFPTAGHIGLPLARASYDAWTSSIFVYTPCVILFFTALINSIRLRRYDHLFAALLVIFLLFTNFAYFFFYGFSGNGYGRWFIVLIPIIVYYCCWGFDNRAEEPKWIPLASAIIAFVSTIVVCYLSDSMLKGVVFDSPTFNPNNLTYWQTTYSTATQEYNGIKNIWFLYYQLGLIAVEGTLLVVGHKKEWLPKAMVIAVSIEAIVMGNIAYAYDGLWSYENSFAGGTANRDTITLIANRIKEKDDSYFKTQCDTFYGSKYFNRVAGLNASGDFHSLMNFDAEDYALANHMKSHGGESKSYGTEGIYNCSWSGFYANKRLATDYTLGYRYYIARNWYAGWKLADGSPLFPTPNVPFGAEEVPEASPDRDKWRIYKVGTDVMPELGWAVDSSQLYYRNKNAESPYASAFYSGYGGETGFRELRNYEETELYGAILEDGTELPSTLSVNATVPTFVSRGINLYKLGNASMQSDYYTVANGDLMVPSTKNPYYDEGLGFFLNHYVTRANIAYTDTIQRDTGMVVFYPAFGDETYTLQDRTYPYWNTSKEGAYFEVKWHNNANSGKDADATPRVYVIGDSFNEDGSLKKENDVLCFEQNVLSAMQGADYLSYYSSTFGLHARGKAKFIVFCFPDSGSLRFDPQNVYVTCEDASSLKPKLAKVQEGALQNVKTSVNRFTFDTAYSSDRVVVTQLGYDAGWQATAYLPGGEKKACQMLKLDGGLVGFVAPYALDENGDPLTVSYELTYCTPYAGLASVAWILATLGYGGYLAYTFIAETKKKKQGISPLAS